MSPEDLDRSGPDAGARPAGLYVVATPIGRLADLSHTAIDVLRQADAVAAEDTRVARVLLAHAGARPAELLSAHAHNEREVARGIVDRIRAGGRVALVSDAGTPGISDPGAHVVAAVHEAGLPVVAVPGPSAVTALLSVAGLACARFVFEGFLPARAAARRARLAALAHAEAIVVLYESPHRILDTADDLAAVLEPQRVVVVGRELTKRFEQVHRTSAAALPGWLRGHPDRLRGEFVLALDAAPAARPAADAADALLAALCEELPARQAARLAARATGLRANDLYRRALARRGAAAQGDATGEADGEDAGAVEGVGPGEDPRVARGHDAPDPDRAG
jgi:16S rRNA (cytidine1402-2'-O)-methyltransferase